MIEIFGQILQKQTQVKHNKKLNIASIKNPQSSYIHLEALRIINQLQVKEKMSFMCSKLLQTICPCLFKRKLDLSNFGDNELIEQQQFITPDSIEHEFQIKHVHKQSSLSTTSSSQQSHSIKANTTTLYSRSEQQQRQFYDPSSPSSSSPLPLILPQQQIFMDYTDTILQDHPYFDILRPKLQTLQSIFDIDQKYLLEIVQSPFPLKLYCKHSEIRKTNIFVYSFQFENTTHEAYEAMLNNFEIQKSFDSNINEYYKKMQSPNNDTKVIYLSYNKVLIVAPRDFIYVRYVFKKGNEFWSIATSIPNEPEQHGKIRGEIILTATKVIEKNNRICVSIYSEVNMKMAIKPEMAKNRGRTQIKKYLEKCYKYLTQNKSETIL